jgi:hypothetical protein
MSNSTNKTNLSENLAKRIRAALGDFNDDHEPVTELVKSVARRLSAIETAKNLGSDIDRMREKHCKTS